MKHGSAYMDHDVTGHTLSHSPGGMGSNKDLSVSRGKTKYSGLTSPNNLPSPPMSPKGKMANTK